MGYQPVSSSQSLGFLSIGKASQMEGGCPVTCGKKNTNSSLLYRHPGRLPRATSATEGLLFIKSPSTGSKILIRFGAKSNTQNQIQSKQKTTQLINFVGIIYTTQSGTVYLNFLDLDDVTFVDLETKYPLLLLYAIGPHCSFIWAPFSSNLNNLKMQSSNQIKLKTKQPHTKDYLKFSTSYTWGQKLFLLKNKKIN